MKISLNILQSEEGRLEDKRLLCVLQNERWRILKEVVEKDIAGRQYCG